MLNYKSKAVNIIFYCIATLVTAALMPITVNVNPDFWSIIGVVCGHIFALLGGGITVSLIILLIRMIFNRKRLFDFFMNTLWCSTLVVAVFATTGQLILYTQKHNALMEHMENALLYNLGYILIAAFYYYKKSDKSKIADIEEVSSDSDHSVTGNKESNRNVISKKKVAVLKWVSIVLAVLAILGLLCITVFDSDSDKQSKIALDEVEELDARKSLNQDLSNKQDSGILYDEYLMVFSNGMHIWEREMFRNNSDNILQNQIPTYGMVKYVKNDNISLESYYRITIGKDSEIWDGAKLMRNVSNLLSKYPSAEVNKLERVVGEYDFAKHILRMEFYKQYSSEYELGDFEHFCKKIAVKDKRRILYDTLKKDHDIGTYDEFERQLGY